VGSRTARLVLRLAAPSRSGSARARVRHAQDGEGIPLPPANGRLVDSLAQRWSHASPRPTSWASTTRRSISRSLPERKEGTHRMHAPREGAPAGLPGRQALGRFAKFSATQGRSFACKVGDRRRPLGRGGARMTLPSPNFAHLAYHDARLIALGTQAEQHLPGAPREDSRTSSTW
jgi:hypothetical protein